MRSKLKGKMTENKEHQAVTRGIKHWGLSGYSSVLPRIKFGVTGQVSSPQSPTISYRHPLFNDVVGKVVAVVGLLGGCEMLQEAGDGEV